MMLPFLPQRETAVINRAFLMSTPLHLIFAGCIRILCRDPVCDHGLAAIMKARYRIIAELK
jgi:hypothetical protein